MKDPILRKFEVGDIDWLVDRHATLYAADEGFDDSFGPLVRRILTDFAADHDPARERGWIADGPQGRLGSIFCVARDDATAKLRLFLVEPAARGTGLAKRMLDTCMAFARSAGYTGMTLWTHESHRAAGRLYARSGWTLERSEGVHNFGRDLVEQTWTYRF